MMLTTTAKVTAAKKYARAKDYKAAAEIADKINLEKVGSNHDLAAIADVYLKLRRYDAAKEVYMVLYTRSKSRKVMTGLIELCLKTKDPKQAEVFLREFRKMEPDNPERLIYRYRVDNMLGKGPEYLLRSLTKLKDEEYTDVWALELAKVYYKADDMEACAAECRNIQLWFADSEVAEKAKVLQKACEEAMAEDVEAEATVTSEDGFFDMDAPEVQEEERGEAEETVEPKAFDERVEAYEPERFDEEAERLTGKAAAEAEEVLEESFAQPELVGSAAETYVLPEALLGKIDRVFFDDDDEEEGEEEFAEEPKCCSESQAVEMLADDNSDAVGDEAEDDSADSKDDSDDDDDDDEYIIRDYFSEEELSTAREEASEEKKAAFDADAFIREISEKPVGRFSEEPELDVFAEEAEQESADDWGRNLSMAFDAAFGEASEEKQQESEGTFEEAPIRVDWKQGEYDMTEILPKEAPEHIAEDAEEFFKEEPVREAEELFEETVEEAEEFFEAKPEETAEYEEPLVEPEEEPTVDTLEITKEHTDLTAQALDAVFREDDNAIERALYNLLNDK